MTGRLVLGGPGDDGSLPDDRRTVREREHRKHLLSTDPLELRAFAGCADAARVALAEDDAFVVDSRLVECLVSASAPVSEERGAAASDVAGVQSQFRWGVLEMTHDRLPSGSMSLLFRSRGKEATSGFQATYGISLEFVLSHRPLTSVHAQRCTRCTAGSFLAWASPT